jgi:hypothetical protein
MRWRHSLTGMLALTVLVGCPSEFGKDGRVNKAVRQDTLELVRKYCTQDKFNRYCSHGRENTPECIEECK